MSERSFRVVTVIALWTIVGQLALMSLAIGQLR